MIKQLSDRIARLDERLDDTSRVREVAELRAMLQRESDSMRADLTQGLNAVRAKVMWLFYSLVGVTLGLLAMLAESSLRSLLLP